MALAPTRLSLEEFLSLPEEKPALEYADGEVTQKVSPKGHHGVLQAEFVERLNVAGRPGKVARAVTELRVTFGGVSRVPDISVYLWDHLPRDSRGRVGQ